MSLQHQIQHAPERVTVDEALARLQPLFPQIHILRNKPAFYRAARLNQIERGCYRIGHRFYFDTFEIQAWLSKPTE